MALVTLTMAKQQLRITDTTQDEIVTWKLAQAEAIILDYLKPARTGETRPDWPWTEATVPPEVQSAVLLMLTHLEQRELPILSGAQEASDEKLWAAIERLLVRHRDQALA